MRTGFRRGRLDKVQQPGAINSYTTALYPPRVYHYYTVPSSGVLANTSVIVGPSIDDGVGDLRGRDVTSDAGVSVMCKKSPPLLRDFVGCFVDVNQCSAEARAFDIIASGNEMLNLLHYPALLCVGTEERSETYVGNDASPRSGATAQKLRLWEEVLNLPNELRCYGVPKCELSNTAMDHLRIRPVKRKRLVKPMRRGAKVFVYNIGEEPQDARKIKKQLTEEDEQKPRGPVQPKRAEGDIREEEGDAGYDKDDDEASLSYRIDDDDDGGDLDGPEGSGDDNDFF
ncbi:hypothetical protein DPX39_000041200 [Trypanosoma brucei equiperdum]|uniref:Uncharacterized protein n=1 Tax=Trypanosoma brucei equiperdum TaxID=630700 RepID=A0A3L6KRD8_9TRYP|nr:hypothetical protein DPX39_000041200 [Trypanosoma brucei equiperdum]